MDIISIAYVLGAINLVNISFQDAGHQLLTWKPNHCTHGQHPDIVSCRGNQFHTCFAQVSKVHLGESNFIANCLLL